MSRDTSILSGKWGWVWDLSSYPSGIQGVITDAKLMGYHGLIIKAADGATVWTQLAESIKPVRDAGLEIGAWTYCYGDDVAGEAKAAIAALDSGASFVSLDVENQYANKKAAAIQMGQLLRQSKPDAVIAFSPWCFVNESVWATVPYAEFAKFCDAIQPQNYWSDYGPTVDVGLKQSDAELKQFNLPIYPIGQTYAGTTYTPIASDYTLFEQTCHSLNYEGVSFWRMGTETPAMKKAVSNMFFSVFIPPITVPPVANTPDTWAQSAWQKALDVKLIVGDSKGVNPSAVVTLEQLAVFFDRAGILDEMRRTQTTGK